MRHDLSIELPLTGSVLISIKMILLEERNTVVSVRGSEIVLAIGDNDLSDSIGVLGLISIGDHQFTSRELFEFSSLGIEDGNVTVRSTNQKFLSVFSKLDAGVELILLLFTRLLLILSSADGFLTAADIGLRKVIVVILSVDVIPKLEVTFSNGESD